MSEARKYRKKPAEVEAIQINSLDYDGMCEIVKWCGGRAVDELSHVIAIDTLEGTMYADPGDWIIRGVADEYYPCKPDIFTQSYEEVPDLPPCNCAYSDGRWKFYNTRGEKVHMCGRNTE